MADAQQIRADARLLAAQDRVLRAARAAEAPGWATRIFSQATLCGIAPRALRSSVLLRGIVPLVVVALSDSVTPMEIDGFRAWATVAAIGFILAVFVPHVDKMRRASEFELLRAPSLRGLFLYRWHTTRLARVLTGLCWAGTVLIMQRSGAADIGTPHLLFAAAVALAPTYLAVQWLVRDALDERAHSGIAEASHALSYAIAIAFVMTTPLGGIVDPPLGVAIGWLAFFALANPLCLRWVTARTDRARAAEHWIEADVELPDILAAAARERPLPTVHFGARSLRQSLWFLDSVPLRNLARSVKHNGLFSSGPLLTLLPIACIVIAVLVALLPVACTVVGVLHSTEGAVSRLWPLLAVLTLPGLLRIPEEALVRVHMLGVDLREGVRNDIAGRLIVAGVAALAGVVAMLLAGASTERLACIALFCAVALTRIGWNGLFSGSGRRWPWGAILVAALIGWFCLPQPGAIAVGVAAAVFAALGAVGIARRRSASEAELRVDLRHEVEEGELAA